MRTLTLLGIFLCAFLVFFLGAWGGVNLSLLGTTDFPYSISEYLNDVFGARRGFQHYLGFCFIYGIPSALQVLFIAPLVGPLRLQCTGRSLRGSVIAAALLAGVLTFFLLWSLSQTVLLYAPDDSQGVAAGESISELVASPFVILPGVLLLSAMWTALLWKAGNTRDPNGIVLLTRQLFAGTAIELALSVPLYLLARRKTDCFCSLGAFWSLILGIIGILWLCGPLCVLLLTRDARRYWARAACRHCGYPRRTDTQCCSECGVAFEMHPASGG